MPTSETAAAPEAATAARARADATARAVIDDLGMACAEAAARAVAAEIERRLPALVSVAAAPPNIDDLFRIAGREIAAAACAKRIRRRSAPLRNLINSDALRETVDEEAAAFRAALGRALARTVPPPAAAPTSEAGHARD